MTAQWAVRAATGLAAASWLARKGESEGITPCSGTGSIEGKEKGNSLV